MSEEQRKFPEPINALDMGELLLRALEEEYDEDPPPS